MILRKLSFEYNGYTFILRTHNKVVSYTVRKGTQEAPITQETFNKYHRIHANRYNNERA